MRTVKIGTRGSRLALWQAKYVEKNLASVFSRISFEIEIIKTEGDRDKSSSLTKIGGQGVFTRAIEDALLDKKVDIAVHSLKDLPSRLSKGLMLAAIPERAEIEDVLITRSGYNLEELPENALIGTGSIRRRSQLLNFRSDLKMADLRGNIETRLRKLKGGQYDGIIMAKAAISRLGIDNIQYKIINYERMIPAVGQGAIGVEVRSDDEETLKLVKSINHDSSYLAILAERAFLHRLDTGCQFPTGAIAFVDNINLVIQGFCGSENGVTLLKEKVSGSSADPVKLGTLLAEKLIRRGALKLIHGV